MLSENTPHSRRFQELLGEIKNEVDDLKMKVTELEKRNAQLQAELKETQQREADVFSSVKETERMALKHQIKGLVSKIDEHLEDQS